MGRSQHTETATGFPITGNFSTSGGLAKQGAPGVPNRAGRGPYRVVRNPRPRGEIKRLSTT
jgi:hypothetical protein